MALDVGLGSDIDAVFVAEVVPTWVVRIVAGAVGIDIKLFHHLDILNHAFDADNITSIRVKLVTVNTLDEYWLSVDKQLATLDFDLAEADALRDALEELAAIVVEGCIEGVKVRCLSRPLERIDKGGVDLCPTVVVDDNGCHLGRCNVLAIGSDELKSYLLATSLRCVNLDVELAVLVVVHEVGSNEEVVDVRLRTCVKVRLACDTAETPEVLVLEIRTVAPTHDLHGDEVLLAKKQIRGDVELSCHLGVLAIAYIDSVNPNGDVASGRTDVHDNLLVGPLSRNLEGTTIGTYVVVDVLHERRIGFPVVAPCITGVDIDRVAKSIEFPHARHRHLAPTGVVEVSGIELVGAFIGVLGPMEFPVAIQRDETVGLVHTSCLCTLLTFESKEVGHVLETILSILAGVVPKRSGCLCHHA